MNDKVKVELKRTFFFTRRPCHVCGGYTEKVAILAEVPDGPYEGCRVCERCIKDRGFDAKLEAYARQLEEQASTVRELIGRLEVPTFAEYQAADAEYDREMAMERCGTEVVPQERRPDGTLIPF